MQIVAGRPQERASLTDVGVVCRKISGLFEPLLITFEVSSTRSPEKGSVGMAGWVRCFFPWEEIL